MSSFNERESMSIRSKLQATLVVLFIFIVILVGLNFSAFAQLDGYSPAVNASGSLRMRAYQLAWLSANSVSAEAGEAADIRRTMEERIAEYDHILIGLERGDEELHLLSPADVEVTAQLAKLKPLWEAYRDDVITVMETGSPAAKNAANAKVAAEVGDYVTEVDTLVRAYDDASRARIALAKELEIAIIVLALIIVVGAFYFIHAQILRPLASLTDSFREVAGKEGDLTQHLTAERQDEIGRIVDSFNHFVSDLRQLVQRAQACSTEVSGLSDTVWQASIENSQAVECNAYAVTSLAERVQEQHEELGTLVQGLAGIASHMEEIQQGGQTEAAKMTLLETIHACTQVAVAASKELEKVSEDITGHTQTSAASIEEQTASLAAFAATAEQMKGAAEELDGLVGRFKV